MTAATYLFIAVMERGQKSVDRFPFAISIYESIKGQACCETEHSPCLNSPSCIQMDDITGAAA